MKILGRITTLTDEKTLEGWKKIYSINDRRCLTIRIEESQDRDYLILFTPLETSQLKNFLTTVNVERSW